MAKRPPAPVSMDEDESRVETHPSGQRPEVKRRLGRMDSEESVSLVAPSPVERGRSKVPRAAVGLRAAPDKSIGKGKDLQALEARKRKLRDARDAHRRKVWDKLDEARRKAEEKRPRIDRFRPLRDGEDPTR